MKRRGCTENSDNIELYLTSNLLRNKAEWLAASTKENINDLSYANHSLYKA